MKLFSVPFLVLLFLASECRAVVDLQVTEIWFGQTGADLTKDWFEFQNVGSTVRCCCKEA